MTTPSHHAPDRARRTPLRAIGAALGAIAIVLTALVATPAAALSGPGPVRLHDPSAIVVGDCTYAYSTGFENDPANPTGSITAYKTCDPGAVTGWAKVGNVFSSTPAWITQSLGRTPPNIWAPDVDYFNGEYHLYYGASVWGTADAVMGLATSSSPEGPWVDQGMVTDVNYPIDPDVIRGEDGALYVSWGSWTGGASWMHALDETTGKLSTTDVDLTKVAVGVEGVSIVRDGDYFYMFGSKGTCCSGVNSTYYTSIARSTSVTGPYVDQNGVAMNDGGGTRILSGYGTKIAAGGGDVFADGDQLKFAYHYYDGSANGRETLDIRPLSFSDGWPVFGSPIGSILPTSQTAVTGRPVPGQTLTGTAATFDKPGTTITFQWLRGTTPIAGATAVDYTPTSSDVGTDLSLRVTATRAGYDSGVSASAPLRILAQPPLQEAIAAAQTKDLAPFTQGSAELFRREVAAVAAAATPGVQEQPLSDRLTDSTLALVSRDTLLSPISVQRSWVAASTPAYGNNESPAANGWRLFDGDLTTNVDTTQPNGSVTVAPTDGSRLSVSRLEIFPRAGLAQRIVGHRFEGSNDSGATWQLFATVSSATENRWTVIDLPSAVDFQRIRMVDNHGGYTNAAEARLLSRAVDTSLLDLLVADAAALDEADYSPESWSALQNAVAGANDVDRADQAAVDAASQALRSALDGLEAPAPVIAVEVTTATPGAAGWSRSDAVVSLSLASGQADLQYRLDGGPWTAYVAPVTVSAPGEHVLDYRGVRDGAPVSGSDGSVPVRIDGVAPMTSGDVTPDSGYAEVGQSVTAVFTATDATSGVARTEYSLDGGAWAIAPAAGVSVTEKGAHVLSYRSVDVAGNVEQARELTLTVTDPGSAAVVRITSADAPTADGWYQQSVVVALSTPTAGRTIQYAINGGGWKTYRSGISVSANGATTISHRVLAQGAVVSGSLAQTLVKVDKAAPTTSATRDPGNGKGTPRNPITVRFAATDAVSGVSAIEYRLNSGAWTASSGDLVLDAVGDYVVSYRATDHAGNVSAVKSTTVTIAADPATSVKAASSVVAGKPLTVSIAGFERWSDVTLSIGSTVVGQVVTDQNGAAKVTVRTPADLAKGKTVLTASSPQGALSATSPITVK